MMGRAKLRFVVQLFNKDTREKIYMIKLIVYSRYYL